MVADIARHAASDGRPIVIFYFSDADPSGWQMPISVARKLQALRDQRFPDLDVQVQPVALTPAQVKEYGLPSTPLKESERAISTGGKPSSVLSKLRSTPSPRSNPDCCDAWPTKQSLRFLTRHCGDDAAAHRMIISLWPMRLLRILRPIT